MTAQTINLSNLTTSQGIYISGATNSTNNGCSVNGIGDLNGDGYKDVIIGNGDASESYVIFGSESPTNINNVENLTPSQGFIISGAPNICFGNVVVAGAGDINNDGYDDIIIGDYQANIYAGVSYVIYGGSSFSFTSNTLDLSSLTAAQGSIISGGYSYEFTGTAVAGAGDVNNDGYDDIIIGATGAGNEYSPYGGAYVILGNVSFSNTISLSNLALPYGFFISGVSGGDDCGSSLAGAGDMNNDGYDDIIIGAPLANYGAGTSYVIYGGEYLLTLPDSTLSLGTIHQGQVFAINAANSNANCGWSVAGAGDVNKDGYDDIIIGAPNVDPNNNGDISGITYIIYGGETFENASLNLYNSYDNVISVYGASYNSRSGSAVAGAGDVNQDGYDDLVIGVPSAPNSGESYILYGKSVTENIPTSAPIMSPTAHPTLAPTLIPTLEPTTAPSTQPTHPITPTLTPTFMPTQVTYINGGGSYNGTGSNQNFIIDSSSDITIYGGGSNNMFTLEPNSNVQITVTEFNNYTDHINVNSFGIYSYNQLNITTGSVIITLEDNQIMKLLALNPSDISANNFVFAPEPTSADDDNTLSTSEVAGIVIGGVVALGAVAYGSYAYAHNLCPFAVTESLASQAAEAEMSGV